MERPTKVAISIPTEGVTTPASYDNRLLMAFHLGGLQERRPEKFEFYWFTAGSMFVPMAREALAVRAVDGGMDLMLMVDDDMLTGPDLFEALFRCMEENEYVDIVAPLEFMRNYPHPAVIYQTKDGFHPVSRQPYSMTKLLENYPRNKLVECDAVGFGAVLIKVDILKRMKRPYFMSTSPTGEDVLFCMNARKTGARVFMDTRFCITHLGEPIQINEEYVDKLRAKEAKA